MGCLHIEGKDFTQRIETKATDNLNIEILIMRLKTIIPLFCLFLAFAGFDAFAQKATVKVKGVITEGDTKLPAVGATVSCGNNGAATDAQGAFSLNVPAGSRLTIRMIGFETQEILLSKDKVQDLGTIVLLPANIGLDAVTVVASIVKKDRNTPVPVSNVTIKDIQTQAPNIEFPELIKTTPSIYVTKGGGGFGDSRINMRGFDSNNLGVLINGVPINDMENGKVYWSNWAGLNDVTSFIQVQRGLGASRLGISSVGGTMNMVTKSTDAKKGGIVYMGIGNDGFNKLSFNVSTGLLDNGWAISIAGSRSSGRGYVNGTDFEGWSYFVNVSKLINAHHRLSFTAFGAPQWHNQRGTMSGIQDFRNDPSSSKRNIAYGYINGKVVGGAYAYNVYHKPQMSLNHYWDIDENNKLYTSVYASLARGGGRRVRGVESNRLAINNRTGRPQDPAMINQTADGLLDYDAVMGANRASLTGSKAIFTLASNSHNWYGILSSYNHSFRDDLQLTAGYDGRFYRGMHYEKIADLLGGDYYVETSAKKKLLYNAMNKPLKVGDRVEYDNDGIVLWNGLFAQLEYSGSQINSFLSTSLTHEGYRYVNNGGTGEKTLLPEGQDKYISKWASFIPWSVKAGASYNFNPYNHVFFNTGYFTRAPFFNSVFFNYSTEINEKAKYERVFTAELGYGFKNEYLRVDLNGYFTKWLDKGLTRSVGNNEFANVTGLNARHMGIELEVEWKPLKTFSVKAMASLGDWIWSDDVNAVIFNDSHEKVAEIHAYVKGVHVGNSAQNTASLFLRWEALKNFTLTGTVLYNGKNFADFDPTNRTKEEDKRDAWRMPDYATVDLGANYRFNIGKLDANLYLNVNNLLNTSYVADARDGDKHDMASALVYMGFGRTWATGLRINF